MAFIRYTKVMLDGFGEAYVGYTEHGICFLTWNPDSDQGFAALVRSRYGIGVWRDDSLRLRWESDLNRWLRGEQVEPELDLSMVTAFERQVMQETAAIPRGKTSTYLQLARRVGKPGASRAVGGVMRRNPILLLVPCHRVVASSGVIGNYSAGGAAVKRRLLEVEGVDLERLKARLQGTSPEESVDTQ